MRFRQAQAAAECGAKSVRNALTPASQMRLSVGNRLCREDQTRVPYDASAIPTLRSREQLSSQLRVILLAVARLVKMNFGGVLIESVSLRFSAYLSVLCVK